MSRRNNRADEAARYTVEGEAENVTSETDARTVAAPSDLDARYGRTAGSRLRQRWLFAIVAVAFVAVFGAWVLWAGLDGSKPTVAALDTGFSVLDARTIDVEFEVSTNPGTTTACAVQALSKEFQVVGWKIVELPASDVRTRALSERLTTTDVPVTGLIYRCWLT